ncbi:type III-B CRISPR module-associated protein Cmr5 [Hydrogenophaga sp. NH-16]|uniref:type III-B CRISPR module-associated protein Cmr5 n=1 Tax=Hydrogenophaga sp. NH-16 TaxID=2184519 RepID=UPI000FDAA362|nr:type III-B CRISPR module-associated protein Cmr5 [Hydrogenophaga sp. NH-16]
MTGSHLQLDRLAFQCLLKLGQPSSCDRLRNACLSLGHHLRAHGLVATVHFGLNGTDAEQKQITSALLQCLDRICPIGDPATHDMAQRLQAEPQATYLLHARLALALADHMASMARALWPVDDRSNTPPNAERPSKESS